MASDRNDLRQRFRHVVTSEAELREIVGHPKQRTLDKVIAHIDGNCAGFIARSPFVFIATVGPDGILDVSPKGDPAGFVRVLDEKTLAIPDRLGNRRLDTFRNVLANPNVGLIFVVPGVTHTLRVSGKAAIVRDEELRQSMAVNGKVPDHALVVSVERALSHCPKCMTRSGLWRPETWPDKASVASLAEMLVAHAKLSETVAEMQEIIDSDGRERLY